MELYLNEKISCKNTLDFLHSQFNNAKTNVHAVQVYKDNELVVRLAPSPYSNTHKRQVYSISKTFAATAIGIACDMGILKVTDKLSDIFTNEISFEQNSNMSELTIWHLLTMSSGHKDCCMKEISLSRDGVSTFFKKEFINTPGESYLYDTGASYMLSAVLTKLTGMSMLDFLNIHLFRHMDIHNITWKFCGGNINEGGIGLNISADDIAKLGLLYINKGIYKGKRILSEKWITDATTGYLAGDFTREPDWKSGYGYQIWRNVQGGSRADGAFGQYCIVVPDKNIIMVILVESENVEMELSLCFNYMNCMFSKNTNDISIKHIENFLNNYYIPFNSIDTIKEEKKLYKINANSNNITFAKTEKHIINKREIKRFFFISNS